MMRSGTACAGVSRRLASGAFLCVALSACVTDFFAAPAEIPETTLELAVVGNGDGYSCGLGLDGRLYCWGWWAPTSNPHDQQGTPGASSLAEPVRPELTFADIAVGPWHACGLTTGGDVYCWGKNDGLQAGRAGGSSTCYYEHVFQPHWIGEHLFAELPCVPQPTRLALPAPATTVAVGLDHTCAALVNASTWCWGAASTFPMGNLTDFDLGRSCIDLVPCSEPVVVELAPRFTALAAGGGHTCALDTIGAAWCWGLGYATGNDSVMGAPMCASTPLGQFPCLLFPGRVDGGRTFVELAAGHQHTCGRDSAGGVWCWGRGPGVLGPEGAIPPSARSALDFNTVTTPVPIPLSEPARALVPAYNATCALGVSGALWCWGVVRDLADPFASAVLSETPRMVAGLPTSVVQAAVSPDFPAGGWHVCGIAPDGVTSCIGANVMGQRGNPGTGSGRVIRAPSP